MGELLIDEMPLEEILTSILLVSGEGMETKYIAEKLQITEAKVTKAIESLKQRYAGVNGIHIITYKNKVQLTTNPDYSDFVAEVLNPIKEKQLTKTALETIAIICYKQPITKTEIENLRGTSSDYAISLLLSNNLIEVVGRKDAVGKPLLYGTTDDFLKRFELADLNELPGYEEIMDRIKVIKTENDSLYNTFQINFEDDEEKENASEKDIPEFLQNEENLQLVE